MKKEMYIFSIDPPKVENIKEDNLFYDLTRQDLVNIAIRGEEYKDILSNDLDKRKKAYVLYLTHAFAGYLIPKKKQSLFKNLLKLIKTYCFHDQLKP